MLVLDRRSPSGRCSAAWSVAAHPADQWHVGSDGIIALGLKKGQHQFLRHVVVGSILVRAGVDFPEGSNMLIMEFGSHYHGFFVPGLGCHFTMEQSIWFIWEVRTFGMQDLLQVQIFRWWLERDHS